ncbi:chitin binding domain-containing protein [Listeria floridensis FSL S10-1187]|uniref:Chitin binding domain-containing protein n=1 Tax=Listeria floridensis FSL S10-1187 TaxID=1265817 RepID=A0ABP3AXD7_9LIST|nr:carbohydrate-binding protein [Listeria floridensis]EUJ29713.1 chitin binding domain-containing protein [Listeria floridensis FSL S10-1187]
MNVTANSVALMWGESQQESGIKEYVIYRNGEKIAVTKETFYTDKGLKANTNYHYQVRSISSNGKESELSNVLTVTTKQDIAQGENVWRAGTRTNPVLYTAGEIVLHNGRYYKTLQTHYNYGDTTWAPDQAVILFALI